MKAKKAKLSLKAGKSKKIKAKMIKPKKKVVKIHIAKLRYESANPAIAKVSGKGKVKGVSKGSTSVYVYAQNGKCKVIKVKVL